MNRRRALADCGRSPNCVSSLASEPARRVDPLHFSGEPKLAMARLRTALQSMAGVRIVASEAIYLRVEFATPLLRFVDDFEALLDESTGVIHLRSASRVGHWDLGANRRRVEALRRKFESLP